MSRYTILVVPVPPALVDIMQEFVPAQPAVPANAYNIAYGYDHALGYFIDFIRGKGDDEVIELNSLFTGLSGGMLGTILGWYEDVPKQHVRRALRNLPF